MKALEIRRRLFGDSHVQTAMIYNNLAANLNDQGKFARGTGHVREALEIYVRVHTELHPSTASCLNNLATSLSASREVHTGPAPV